MSINVRIANNVKKIREEKHITLDKAAALTGVSRSMLSQIEKGDVNPTISVIWKIANGFKVSFTSIMEEDNLESVVVKEVQPLINDKHQKYLNYPTFTFDDKKHFEMYRILIEEGGILNAEPHLVKSEEYITIFDGRAEISVGEEKFILEKGDSLKFAADQKHSYKNAGEGTCAISMLIYYS